MTTYRLPRALAPTLVLAIACTNTPPASDETGTDGSGDGDGDGETGDGDGDLEELRSEAPHDQDPQLTPEAIDALAAANHALTLDLYHALREGEAAGEGFSVSAYSLASAFGMLYAGSVDPARGEIAQTLRFDPEGEQQHIAHNWLDAELDSRNIAPGELGEGEDGDGLTLDSANRLWLLDTLAEGVSTEFLDLLSVHYDAGVGLADFAGDPEAERQGINAWVAERTGGLIPELFPADSIDIYTTMVLANALYLKSPWAYPFSEFYTQERDFSRLDGQTVPVQMMRAPAIHHAYAQTAEYQVVALPLWGAGLDLYLIMPTDFAGFEASLDPATLAGAFDGLSSTLLDLSVPRFQLDTAVELKDELEALGLSAPFADPNSFDGIHPEVDTIGVVVHNTVVAIDEDGIEAAAASGIGGDGDGDPDPDPEPPLVVVFDKPFLIAVKDRPTGTLLFFGRVLDPS